MVGRLAEDEGARVADKLLLLVLIADDILHTGALKVVDAADLVCCAVPTEYGIGRHISIAVSCVER